jgi:polysaccharide biosynthesis/export protein
VTALRKSETHLILNVSDECRALHSSGSFALLRRGGHRLSLRPCSHGGLDFIGPETQADKKSRVKGEAMGSSIERVNLEARATRCANVRRNVPPLLGIVVVCLSMLQGCASSRAGGAQVRVTPQVLQSETRFRKEYVLSAGDQIEVVVRRTPEASHTVTIRPDGHISLPLLDDVTAAGMTPRELDAKLTELFSARLVEPEVAVIATQVRQPMVYVVGDVTNTVALPLRDAPTAMQAITLAGGLRRSAAARDIAIIRLSDDGYLQAIPITVKGGGQPGPYMALMSSLLQPDDIIFVPENGRSQFSRLLDDLVNRPLFGINSLVQTFVNFRLVRELNR